MMMSAIRLVNATTLMAKEPASPIVRSLKLDDITDEQLLVLSKATPWAPMRIYLNHSAKEGVTITHIEIPPAITSPKPRRVLRHGFQRRNRIFVSL